MGNLITHISCNLGCCGRFCGRTSVPGHSCGFRASSCNVERCMARGTKVAGRAAANCGALLGTHLGCRAIFTSRRSFGTVFMCDRRC